MYEMSYYQSFRVIQSDTATVFIILCDSFMFSGDKLQMTVVLKGTLNCCPITFCRNIHKNVHKDKSLCYPKIFTVNFIRAKTLFG